MIQLDCREMTPGESVKVISRVYRKVKSGDIIELLTTDNATEAVVLAWCNRTRNTTTRIEYTKGVFAVEIKITGKKNITIHTSRREDGNTHAG